MSGVEIETGFGTVPYFSMGQAAPGRPGVLHPPGLAPGHHPGRRGTPRLGANPSALTLIAWDGAYINDSVRYTAPACVTGAVWKCRGVITTDFRTSSFATPMRKWLKIEARWCLRGRCGGVGHRLWWRWPSWTAAPPATGPAGGPPARSASWRPARTACWSAPTGR
ncbi:MAG: hypothetical protein IPG75_17220 [Gemmatimonadetes bacterium]|nr:hypothetical protein [Gemmatimonadota bacterium]